MHRAAPSLVEAGDAREDFRVCAVNQEVASQVLDIAALAVLFHHLESGAAEEILHDLLEGSVVKLADGGKPLCQNLGV